MLPVSKAFWRLRRFDVLINMLPIHWHGIGRLIWLI
jgi:hypothetical protein